MKCNALPTQSPALSKEPLKKRLFYLDNLRCIAMLLGILLHAGLAYGSNISHVWYVKDITDSAHIEVGLWFIHLFRMALFFFIAGYFAKLMMSRKGVTYFLKNRCFRLIIPFLLFLPLVVLAINNVVLFAVDFLTNEQTTLHYVHRNLVSTTTELSKFRTYHLWFVYYLILFCGLAVIFQNIKSHFLCQLMQRVFTAKYSPIAIMLLILPSHLIHSIPMPTPESLIPELWVFGYYGIFFLYGWYFFTSEKGLGFIKDNSRILSVSVLLCYVVLYHYIPDFSSSQASSPSPIETYLIAIMQSFCAVVLVLRFVGLAQRWLSKPHTVAKYFSSASYTAYLVHLPVTLLLQVIVAEMNLWV